MEPSKKRENEPIKVKQEIEMPWEKKAKESEQSVYSRINKESGFDKFELSREESQKIDKYLLKEYDELYMEIAKDWFLRHKEEIKNDGLYQPNEDDNYILSLFKERGGIKEFEKLDDSKSLQLKEKREMIDFYRSEVDRSDTSIAGKTLILNLLEKRREKKYDELRILMAQPPSPEQQMKIDAKNGEIEDLFNVRKKIAESIRGVDLSNESENLAVSTILPKDQFISRNLISKQNELLAKKLESHLLNQWQGLSDPEKQKYNDFNDFKNKKSAEMFNAINNIGLPAGVAADFIIVALIDNGYDPSKFKKDAPNWIWRFFKGESVELKKGQASLSLEDYDKMLTKLKNDFAKKAENDAKDELAKDWGKVKEEAVKRIVDEKIKDIASAPEKNIKEAFEKAREWRKRQYLEDLSKETFRNKEKVKELFEGQGIDITDFMSKTLGRKGSLDNLTGNLEKDADNISEFLNEYGLDTDAGEIFSINEALKNQYSQEAGKQKGFLEWLIKLIIEIASLNFKEQK